MGRTSGGKKVGLWAAATLLAAAGAVCLVSIYVQLRYASRVVPLEQAPEAEVALVFGAGLAANQVPSPLLAERLDTAIQLYRTGKVQKLLLSGDNSDRRHDETRSMRRYAAERGIPTTDVVADYAGLSTYDTCFRAKAVFGVTSAVLVTQAFHLPRALFVANSLGIDAYGIAADAGANRSPHAPVREFFSRVLAFGLVAARPDPKFLGRPEPIR